MNRNVRAIVRALAVCGVLAVTPFGAGVWAADLPADVQARVDAAKKKLTDMAANPAVVAAVKEANAKGAGDMNNAKWTDLNDGDAAVKAFTGSKVSAQIAKWEADDKTINKLVLRDGKGNLVGANTKPLLFNNASRPQFANPIKGQAWSTKEVKPDPTTQVPSVQLGVPVLDGGNPIGVLHAGVSAK